MNFTVAYSANNSGTRSLWFVPNGGGGSTFFGVSNVTSVTGDLTRMQTSFQRRFVAGNTIQCVVQHNANTALNLGTDTLSQTQFVIDRMHE